MLSQDVFEALVILGTIMGSSVLIVFGTFFLTEHFFKNEEIDDILKKWDEEGW